MLSSKTLLVGLRQTQLNDPEGVTWTDSVLIVALNEALCMLALVRPDATAKTAVLEVVKGARQSLPNDGLRLLSVICNIDTVTNEQAQVIRLVQKEDMDSANYTWLTAKGTIVREYVYDARNPKQFFIYPNVPIGSKIEIEYSATPSLVSSMSASDDIDIDIDAIYAQPIQELILYKLLSGDSVNGQSGADHLTIAMELLGLGNTQDERLSAARKTEA